VNAKTLGKHSPIKPHTKKIDQEATRRKRPRNEWIELYFETIFFRLQEIENEIKIKTI
jgi:hypothetical protein